MTPSRIFFAACLSFVGGVAWRSLFEIHLVALWTGGFFIFGVFLVTVFWKYKVLVFAGFCIMAVLLGALRQDTAASRITRNELLQYNDQEKQAAFAAKVAEDPDKRARNAHIVLEPDFVSPGKILATVDRFSDWRYGDVLMVKGELQTPGIFDDFNYRNYLAKDGIYSVMYQPEIELVARGAYDNVFQTGYAAILRLKQKFRDTLHARISAPESAILGAIVLGDKSRLSDDLKEKLNAAGVRHITAISGMHVVILTKALMLLLIGVGLWRQQAFYATVGLMALFIVLTGLQPSAIRAGIMGGMLLLAEHLGRLNASIRALVFAAAAMLALNPLLLANDAGFQLSFLAVLGIILFLPVFQHLSRKIPERFSQPRDLVGMTIAAQLLTFPLLIFNFGYISSVSVITNILIVPILPSLMGTGFAFLFTASLFEPLGFILSLPVVLLLAYIQGVIELFASLPFAQVPIENLSAFWLAAIYIPIGLLYWKLRKHQEFLTSSV